MDQISDNYISYDENFTVKQERLSDSEDSIVPPLLASLEPKVLSSTSVLPVSQNFLNTDGLVKTEPSSCESYKPTRKSKPFIIIKMKKEESVESGNFKFRTEEKLLNKSKRIAKRFKAKQRNQLKQEYSCSLSSDSSKYAPEGLDDVESDAKTKKKIVQMIRNRVSAQTSREKKKAYVQNLEQAKSKLGESYTKLFSENAQLLLEIKNLKASQAKILQENVLLKNLNNFTCSSCGQNTVSQPQSEVEGSKIMLFEKEMKDLAALIASKVPNYNSAEFQNTLKCAIIASFALLTNTSGMNRLDSSAMNHVKDTDDLINEALEHLASLKPGGFSVSSAMEQLQLLKQGMASTRKSTFDANLQDEFGLDPCLDDSDEIKVEQPEGKSHSLLFSQMFGFRDGENADPNCPSDEPTLTSFSPKTLKYCNDNDDEDHEKGSLFQSCFKKLEFTKETEKDENSKFNFFDSKQSFLSSFSEYCAGTASEAQDPEPGRFFNMML